MGIFSKKTDIPKIEPTEDIPFLTEDEKMKVREIIKAMIKYMEDKLTNKTREELEKERKNTIKAIMAVNGDLLVIPKTEDENEIATEEDFQTMPIDELIQTYKDTIQLMERVV